MHGDMRHMRPSVACKRNPSVLQIARSRLNIRENEIEVVLDHGWSVLLHLRRNGRPDTDRRSQQPRVFGRTTMQHNDVDAGAGVLDRRTKGETRSMERGASMHRMVARVPVPDRK